MTRTDPLAAPIEAVAGELWADDDLPPDEEFEAEIYRPPLRADAPDESEGEVAAECLGWLKVQPQCAARKVQGTSAQGGGEPDLDIVWRGRAVKIELKAPGRGKRYRPTDAQHQRLLDYQAAGALVGYATSLAQLQQILARADDPTYRYRGQAGAPTPDAPHESEDDT